MIDEIREAARQAINQWENHDKYRVAGVDALFLIDGQPPEVHWAWAYWANTEPDDDELIDTTFVEGFPRIDREYDSIELRFAPLGGRVNIYRVTKNATVAAFVLFHIRTRQQFRDLYVSLGGVLPK